MESSRNIIEKRAKVHAPQRKNCHQPQFECLSSHGKIIQKCREMKIEENSQKSIKKTKENGNVSSSKRRLNDRSSSESGNDSLSDREGETSIPSKNSRYENGTVQSSAENVNIDNKQDIINSSFGTEVEITTYQINYNLDNLPEDIYEAITKHLSDVDILKLFFLNIPLLVILKSANGVLKKLTLRLDKHNFEKFNNYTLFYDVQLRNIVFDFKDFINLSKPVKFLENFVSTIENLHIKNAKFKSFIDFSRFCSRLRNIKILKFENCGIDQLGNNFLPELLTLNQISFHKCNDLMYKAFKNQTSLTKIEVSNQDWTWNGFPHETFNEICKNCKKLDHIVLSGAGTGSYFDADEFPYKIRHLESTMITFHWYVGIKSARVSFLESQKGFLKDLRIHQLPNDFDGGRVLNYIFKEMNLDTFIYGDIPLMLKGQKQQPTGFSATEIQIKAAIELIAQFPSITSYCLILSATDIASDEIEKAINPRNTVFHQLKKFEVIDNSKYRGLFGVFLGLLKNLINIEVLSLKTQDRNINVLLEESLPYMTEIKEIYLPSMASRGKERLNIIKNKAPTLKKLSIDNQFVEEAKIIFGNSVEICGITT